MMSVLIESKVYDGAKNSSIDAPTRRLSKVKPAFTQKNAPLKAGRLVNLDKKYLCLGSCGQNAY
jgi:hypothetical protein